MSGHKSEKKGPNIICRVSNVTPEMVCRYVERLPKQEMTEDAFRNYMGKRWFQNEHQAPEQWGLYYIDGTNYYPRFDHDVTIEEADAYLYHWMRNLIVINPYTRFKKQSDKKLVESIVNQLEKNPNEHDLKTIIRRIIDSDEPFVINEIIANALNNYSRALKVEIINKDEERFNVSLLPNYKELLKSKNNMTKKEYFELFDAVKIAFAPDAPLQKIFYGAPGTGKSNTIKREVDENELPCIRTTFHPDSDYSTFVGAYKPIMEDIDVKVTPVVVENGISLQPSGTYKERRIAYKFVKQAFLKAYLGAWKKYADQIVLQVSVDAGNGEKWILKSVNDIRVDAQKESFMDKDKFEKNVKKYWNKPGNDVGNTEHWVATACKWYKEKFSNVQNPTEDDCWNAVEQALDAGKTISATPHTSQTYYIKKGEDGKIFFNNDNQTAYKNTIKENFKSDSDKSFSIQASIARKLKEFSNDNFEEAWEELKKIVNNKNIAPQFLVIEEINRGNCAQIFGDIFQLLDRSDNGFSTYPIEADTDLQQEVSRAFKEDEEYKLLSNIEIEGKVKNYTSNYGANLSKDVQEGHVMLLPPNLYIWATMNTSDQSLFPIDSAFKRRWDWEYMPIGYKNDTWTIKIGTKEYNWVDFQRKINEKIYDVDNSEDKQLGDYFVNADRTGNEISSDTLLNKILFYLWNDVCKDDPDIIFKWVDDKDDNKEKSIKFSDFFREEKERKLQGFMAFLKIDAIDEGEGTNESNDDNSDKDGKEFSYNGTVASMREIAASVVSDYAKTNSGMNAQQVRDYFIETFKGIGIAHIVETESEYRQRDGQSSQQRTATPVTIPNGENIYVSTQWRAGKESDNFYQFMKIVNEKGLGTINSL